MDTADYCLLPMRQKCWLYIQLGAAQGECLGQAQLRQGGSWQGLLSL